MPIKKHSFAYFVLCIQLLLVPAALVSAPASAWAADDLEEVTATGKALLSLPDHKKDALRDAMQNAVQKAVGVQVKSDALVQNFQLIHDRILFKSEGYVKQWRVVREQQEGDSYVVEIAASIGKGELNKDLYLNGIDVEMIYDWIGKPRIVVLLPDYVDGKKALTAFAQSEVETLFRAKGIMVLSDEQVKSIQQRDAALAFDNPKKAVALAQRFGAEIVIVGKCISTFSREIAIDSFKAVFYSSVLQVKAYNTSNAQILMSATYTEAQGETDTSALGRTDASTRSIQNVVRSNAKDIVFQVVKHWTEGVNKPTMYQVIVSGVQHEELSALEHFLSTMPDVVKVYRRSFNQEVAELELEFKGLQSSLVHGIEKNKKIPLRLVSDEPLRISFEKRGPKQ
jgi:hypothetical protein